MVWLCHAKPINTILLAQTPIYEPRSKHLGPVGRPTRIRKQIYKLNYVLHMS